MKKIFYYQLFLLFFLLSPAFADLNVNSWFDYLQFPNKFFDFYNTQFSSNLMEKVQPFEGPVQIFLEGYDEV